MADVPTHDPSSNEAPGPGLPTPDADALGLKLRTQRLLAELFGIDESTHLNHYELIRELGHGGMGVVYLARDHQLDREVAIKTLTSQADAQLRERLVDEARAMARVQHPNVVTVFEIGQAEGLVFIVMEYVEGMTLQRWLSAQPRSHSEIIEVFAAAGEGLAAAHDRGLVHRDFKPANVMIADDGRVRVLDFGLARQDPSIAETVEHERGASPPVVAGTARYMAPEQVGGRWVDARSDQFAFCVALYEALYGEHPYGVEPAGMWAAAERGELREAPAHAQVPGWMRDIIVRGLAADPRDRFDSVRALLISLVAGDPAQCENDWRLRLHVTFSADYDLAGFDDAERARIQDVLRLLTRDPRLSIESVFPGSIVLEIEVSRRGAERLQCLYADGTLAARLGVAKVLTVREIPEVGDDEALGNDEAIFAAWRAGDKRAGKTLIERYYAYVDRFFRFKVGKDHCEDLTQETFLAVQGSLERFRGESSFRARLFGIARATLLKHLRERCRDPQRFDPDANSVADLDQSPDTLIDAERHHRLLLAALRRLPIDAQLMLELHYWEQMTITEIAAIVGKSANAVKSQIRRGRLRLEELMGELAASQEELDATRSGLGDWPERVRRDTEDNSAA